MESKILKESEEWKRRRKNLKDMKGKMLWRDQEKPLSVGRWIETIEISWVCVARQRNLWWETLFTFQCACIFNYFDVISKVGDDPQANLSYPQEVYLFLLLNVLLWSKYMFCIYYIYIIQLSDWFLIERCCVNFKTSFETSPSLKNCIT